MSRQAVAATPQAVATSAVLKRTFQDEVYGSIIRLSYGERLDKVLAQKRTPMVARQSPHPAAISSRIVVNFGSVMIYFSEFCVGVKV